MKIGSTYSGCAICIAFVSVVTNATAQDTDKSLHGTWGIETAKVNGKPMVAPRAILQFEFRGDRVLTRAGDQSLEAVAVFDVKKSPRQFDITIGNRTEQFIYKVDGDTLTVCSSVAPAIPPTTFTTRPGDKRSVYVLRRMKPAKLKMPVTKDEAAGLAKQLQEDWAAADESAFAAVFDQHTLLDRATSVPVSERIRLSFLSGFTKASRVFSQRDGFGRETYQKLAGCSSFTFIRLSEGENEQRALFRIVHESGDFWYYELAIARNCYGNVRVVDIHNFLLDSWTSDIMRRAAFPGLAASEPSLLQSATDSEKRLVEFSTELRQLAVAIQRKDMAGAMTIYRKLPEKLRQEKWLILGLLSLAKERNQDDEVEFLMRQCEPLPTESGLDLFFLQHYQRAGDVSKTRALIQQLNRRVGGDQFLTNLLSELD